MKKHRSVFDCEYGDSCPVCLRNEASSLKDEAEHFERIAFSLRAQAEQCLSKADTIDGSGDAS